MLPALALVLAVAPFYWLLVPERHRSEALACLSFVGLAVVDWRLVGLVTGTAIVLFGALRAMGEGRTAKARWVAAVLILGLAGLFLWNKIGGTGLGVLPSQSGLALLGVSYLVLKAAAVLVAAARGQRVDAGFFDVFAWLVFLPTYPSGPIEELAHFRAQRPAWVRDDVLRGVERILFGLGKTLLLSHYLGLAVAPVFEAPEAQSRAALLLATYAATLRFYFDFSGYSDLAIGVSAVFGVRIQENFDHPLTRRNLTQLWQRWHMTLTHWLRSYLFVPTSRALLRRAGRRTEGLALLTAQVVTMGFCGLWHGLGWNFLAWGLMQAVGLFWLARFARPLGGLLPASLRSAWQNSPIGYVASCLLTFHYFALSNVLIFCDSDRALAVVVRLFGVS